ncbi:hypothetical protein E1B28_005764 [Marasmius oreades]|uniref:DUF3533 domain-containing protein n=1 Tax=Marasmius oreades TaxID=181124 RepID=A0A9P7S5U7_9AGAR|nr:uncharacterized protein E1B28_005764 [Marasmius oreades]KAG7094963.1 hypothetical protein E1B28_005764 [Marasmius oreades]
MKTLDSNQTERDTNEHHIPPFSASFTDEKLAVTRSIYLKVFIGGVLSVTIAMFAVFSIFWGAFWKTPSHSLHGWVVDFDQSTVGNVISETLLASSPSTRIQWLSVSASVFPGGVGDVMQKVFEEKTWVAVVINPGATNGLNLAATSADPSYNGSLAVTVYAEEARNENAFRSVIRPTVEGVLETIAERFAQQFAQKTASSSSNLQDLLTNAPQVITRPIGYTINNTRPFDIPVATAITFVGLIYLLILTFFIVMIGLSAREISGLENYITTASLIRLRLATIFGAYFFLSLFYSLLSLAFQVDFTRKFGHAGFVVFWMVNFAGMLSVGLALEAMITLLTVKGVPFFLILWIIANVSVCLLPMDVLPWIFHYGYASPFYNVSRAVRTILFDTRNNLGLNFGVLIAWVVISCITLPLFQWFMRRRHISEVKRDDN